jgi:arsenate reductase
MSTGVTIYHNPACGTSRNVLAMIRNSGVEPTIVEYLKNPPNTGQIRSWLTAMGATTVRQVLREKAAPYAGLDLANPKWTDEEVLSFIQQHPVLLNRPIVVTPLGVRLCRPAELVLDILPQAA